MKKRMILAFFTLLISIFEIPSQIYVWKNGKVIFSVENEYPDSVTFSNPNLSVVEPADTIPPDTFLFSVNDTLQVRFAPGNLQYNDYYFEWRFAENQYDLIGISNSNIAPFYDGWIDLFGWATCGWSTGFLPTSTSTDYRDYLVGESWDNSFVGEFATADWGALNKIGSDAEHTWRTPTSKEWNYLLAERRNADQLFALATVANVKGLILLPDNWKTPEEVKFIPSVSTEINNHLVYQNGLYMDEEMLDDHYADNTYNEAEWTVMEKSGAIFLPAGGRRWGNTIKNYPTNPWGIYWSSTTGSQEREGNVRALSFYMSGVTPLAETSRVWGCSVRLIQEIK